MLNKQIEQSYAILASASLDFGNEFRMYTSQDDYKEMSLEDYLEGAIDIFNED